MMIFKSNKKRGYGLYIFLIFVAFIAVGSFYLYNSQIFERDKPEIQMQKNLYWNLKTPIAVKISDSSGIKFVRILLNDGSNTMVLLKKVYNEPKKYLELEVKFPKVGFFSKKESYNLTVEAVDDSKWNFFAGNTASFTSTLYIDTKKPRIQTIAQSYAISKGGAAVVIFKARDQNLKEVYVESSDGYKFKPTKFYKDGHYISLVAWDLKNPSFKADVVAVDKAGNKSEARVKYYLKNRHYKTSKLKLNDSFLEGAITDLADKYLPPNKDFPKLDMFKFVNETLRNDNEKLIKEVTRAVPKQMLMSAKDDGEQNEYFLKLKPFYPLKNGAAVASFGDHRFYSYNDKQVSESYHLGLDLASTEQATIVSSNKGKVVFAKENGIYGLNLIINHGLGLYSLYGHCSSFTVDVGDEVKSGDEVATTGITGLALGDHLHFGMLVQGIEVRPEEWMDSSWMQDNVYNVIEDAKKIIDKKI